jgi:hypothetical protein
MQADPGGRKRLNAVDGLFDVDVHLRCRHADVVLELVLERLRVDRELAATPSLLVPFVSAVCTHTLRRVHFPGAAGVRRV